MSSKVYVCDECGALCREPIVSHVSEDCTPYGGPAEPGFMCTYTNIKCPNCRADNTMEERYLDTIIDSLMDNLMDYLYNNHSELFDEDGDLDVALCNDNCEDFPSCFNEQVNTQKGLSLELDFDYYKQGENKIYLTYSYEVED